MVAGVIKKSETEVLYSVHGSDGEDDEDLAGDLSIELYFDDDTRKRLREQYTVIL
jgi:hypothetical protein